MLYEPDRRPQGMSQIIKSTLDDAAVRGREGGQGGLGTRVGMEGGEGGVEERVVSKEEVIYRYEMRGKGKKKKKRQGNKRCTQSPPPPPRTPTQGQVRRVPREHLHPPG